MKENVSGLIAIGYKNSLIILAQYFPSIGGFSF